MVIEHMTIEHMTFEHMAIEHILKLNTDLNIKLRFKSLSELAFCQLMK